MISFLFVLDLVHVVRERASSLLSLVLPRVCRKGIRVQARRRRDKSVQRHDGGDESAAEARRWCKGAFLLLRSVLSRDARRKFPSPPPLLILQLRISVVHQNLGGGGLL